MFETGVCVTGRNAHSMNTKAKCAELRVSVVMPVLNGEDNVEVAVNSILDQTFQDFEFIIVDDGSTDSTGRLLSRAAECDDRIRIVKQSSQGVAMAIQAGIAVSSGAYIARMDADDLAMPDRLESQVAFLDQNEEVVAVGGQVRIIDGHGVTLRSGNYPIDSQSCHDHLRFGSPFAHPAVTVRRTALQQCGGYRKRFEPAEDYDLWLRLSLVGKFANLDQCVLQYRVQAQGVTEKRFIDMARASAMALCAHAYGEKEVPATWDQLHQAGINWESLEAELQPSQRLPLRATFLRGLILNGGIVDDKVFSVLTTSLPVFSRHCPDEIAPDILAFMILRTVAQNARSGKMFAALRSLYLGLRYVPLPALLKDIKALSKHKVLSLYARRFSSLTRQGSRGFESSGSAPQNESR